MMDRETRVIVIAALLAGTVAAQAGPAQAQTASIRYHGYELQTRDGAKAVLARIQGAAKRACLRGPTLAEFKDRRPCRAELTAQMVKKVDDRVVTALWSGRSDVQLADRGR